MKLAKVIGRVTLSRKDERLKGARLIIAAPVEKAQIASRDFSGFPASQANFVLYDGLGAEEGDIIGYVEGAEATAPFDHPIPIDSYNVCIIERVNYNPNA